MIKSFIKCGVIGWCLEILWTGFCSMLYRDFSLTAKTSIWMFFIYGMATFISPLYNIIKEENFIIRGGIYTVCIFTVEFLTGFILRSFNICPWDYSGAPTNIAGLIRLDYAPLWFFSGLLFEKILIHPQKEEYHTNV